VDVPAFEFPPGLAGADMVGAIYEIDGLNFYSEYGMLRWPAPRLAARHTDARPRTAWCR